MFAGVTELRNKMASSQMRLTSAVSTVTTVDSDEPNMDTLHQNGVHEDQHDDGAIDQDKVDQELAKWLGNLQHHLVNVRASAARKVAAALGNEDLKLQKYCEAMAKALASPVLLDLKAGSDDLNHSALHISVCEALTHLQASYPGAMMKHWKPLCQYLVSCLDAGQGYTVAACCYWGSMGVPPVPTEHMEVWLGGVTPRLGRLLPGLLNAMKYSPDLWRHLEEGHTGPLPDDLKKSSRQRNMAALALDTLAQLFMAEVVGVVKGRVLEMLGSKDYVIREAGCLAVGAFTQAVGTPRELADLYPTLIPQLITGYNHEKALVRAITCFTMQQFINVKLRGVKDSFPRLLKGTTSLLQDPCPETRSMALQALAEMLGYAERDISPHLKRVIGALVKAEPHISGSARFTYYDCIGHLYGRAGSELEKEDAASLTRPLMEEWSSLTWRSKGDIQKAVQLCQSLCLVAMYARQGFTPHNSALFSKAVSFISTALDNEAPEADSEQTHVVACLDLLSATFEGQGSDLSQLAREHDVCTVLVKLLKNSDFPDRVHQSSLALLGHITQHCYPQVLGQMGDALPILHTYVRSPTPAIYNNALWVTAHLVIQHGTTDDKLLGFKDYMVAPLEEMSNNQGLLINAALGLTALAAQWPEVMTKVITKDTVLQPICGLLQQQFPRDLEKVAIFTRLCEVLSCKIKTLKKDLWIHVCVAAAVLDAEDDNLIQGLRGLLRDVRGHLGNTGWNKISQLLGSQLSYTLRKRYKLY